MISPISVNNFFGSEIQIFGCAKLDGHVNETIVLTGTVNILNNFECENKIYQIVRRRMHIPDHFICTQQEPYTLLDNVSTL
jgi:hypothetical protein